MMYTKNLILIIIIIIFITGKNGDEKWQCRTGHAPQWQEAIIWYNIMDGMGQGRMVFHSWHVAHSDS